MTAFWPFRIFPKSLYGQILLVAASALLLAQGINAAWLLSGARNRAVGEASAMVVTRVANQLERQEATGVPVGSPDGWRQERSDGKERKKRRAPPVTISVDSAPVTITRSELEHDITARAQEFLRQGELTLSDVRVSSVSVALLPQRLRDPQIQRWQASRFRKPDQPMPKTAVLLSARLPGGQWINAAGLVRANENMSVFVMLLQTLTLYVAVMIPLALVARRIAKPLGRLTERVQRVGLATEAGPMPSEGPNDVRQLIDAFNNMQTRVTGLLGEKDVMLGAIGHDLKTPLAALRVRVESVDDDHEREKMAATIDEMVTILDDILMLARLGKSGEAMQSVDIGALAESISGEFPSASFIEPDSRVVAQVRPVLLRRALRNLIDNAVTYGKSATVAVGNKDGKTTVEICDDGPGIAPSLMEGIFEPFTRTESSRNRATGGSGLGLTIARAIARSHGGDVSLENRSEGGLRVVLSFRT
jgi:signal transduction histidine kinase